MTMGGDGDGQGRRALFPGLSGLDLGHHRLKPVAIDDAAMSLNCGGVISFIQAASQQVLFLQPPWQATFRHLQGILELLRGSTAGDLTAWV